jgi:tRNA modification GTPase
LSYAAINPQYNRNLESRPDDINPLTKAALFQEAAINSTIAALSTPPGRSGIAVIRLSGTGTAEITARLTRDNSDLRPRHASLKKAFDINTGDLIDEIIVTFFKAPNSFTGEDVAEISCHGSPVLIRQILDICLRLGARTAEAGEFSLRALANGRMDLAQAEAVRDLIDARSAASARQAVRQLKGEVSHSLQPLKDDLLNIIVVLESTLEFVEDDLPDVQVENIGAKLGEIIDAVNKFAASFQAGRLLREGLKVTLAGRPNVGKSSLFNALLGQDRAIVTEIAGTTRDSLHESLTIEGIPISLADTAGLRESADIVEAIGVERTKRSMADSDVVLVILDGSKEIEQEDLEIINTAADVSCLITVNKTDLPEQKLSRQNIPAGHQKIEVSALTGTGLDELREAIIAPFAPHEIETGGFLISDARHFDLLTRASLELESARTLMQERASEEIVLIGLHNAMRLLGEITGETTTEQMLTRIFSTFCIGK